MKGLDSLEAPSAIIGGVAVNAHGVARVTADIDASRDVERLLLTSDDIEVTRIRRVLREIDELLDRDSVRTFDGLYRQSRVE